MPNPIGMFAPLPWRKITPLHKQLGARAIRFVYTNGTGLPLTATPQTMFLRYGPDTGIDRIVGFNLSIANSATPTNFALNENATGWQFSFVYPGSKGVYILGNVETLPDEVNLTWSFS